MLEIFIVNHITILKTILKLLGKIRHFNKSINFSKCTDKSIRTRPPCVSEMYDDFPVQSFVKWPDENKRQQHQKIDDQATHEYNVEEQQMTDPPRLDFSKQPHSN